MNTRNTGGADQAAHQLQRRLGERALLGRRVEGDRLALADATLLAALDGSRPLTAGERAALQASPLTARRLRQLALERRARSAADANGADANGAGSVVREAAGGWRGSRGMLRAASSGAVAALATDDGCWTLHLLRQEGAWRAILQLSADAPFAAQLLAARTPLRVCDGAGAVLLQGCLDDDGECEAAWPFAAAPGAHLQAHGAGFSVEPCSAAPSAREPS
ncbi:hypothetical protein HH212_23890 [Massilia forsythiae]|uniref:Uncharacterized protein n=1 Tax=Massilia forsythiae TaxID=2728020 RepID=A0A7Z2ZUV2_9BURK|nr:hypothetical protein [Massilia forsythiae]QJE02680.1 hypothetical protein HH212_23890 [Massilia forsythiae]